MAPTKITEEPIHIMGTHGGHGKRLYRCDDGKQYSHIELAEIIGISNTTLHQRIKKYGWKNTAYVFRGPNAPLPHHVNKVEDDDGLPHITRGDLANLSDKPRAHQLNKLKDPTPIERRMFRI